VGRILEINSTYIPQDVLASAVHDVELEVLAELEGSKRSSKAGSPQVVH